jgi:hypothetical protein
VKGIADFALDFGGKRSVPVGGEGRAADRVILRTAARRALFSSTFKTTPPRPYCTASYPQPHPLPLSCLIPINISTLDRPKQKGSCQMYHVGAPNSERVHAASE